MLPIVTLLTVRTAPQTYGPGRKELPRTFYHIKVYYSCTMIYLIATHHLLAKNKIRNTNKPANKQDHLLSLLQIPKIMCSNKLAV